MFYANVPFYVYQIFTGILRVFFNFVIYMFLFLNYLILNLCGNNFIFIVYLMFKRYGQNCCKVKFF